ncbi:hypothetical protein GF351_04930 [Candidatus Woesearchaeota archaeon]|nr:hypothetical protein [Candidatus Woesearchaeota archaeon]
MDNITENDYFILCDDPGDDTGFTHVLQYKSLDASEDQITFKDEGTGDSIKVSYTTQTDGSLILSGKEYSINI